MTAQPASEIEDILTLLYACPVGVVQLAADGEILLVNPVAMKVLLVIAEGGPVTNLFDVLCRHSTDLREMIPGPAAPQGTIFAEHRIFVGESEAAGAAMPQVLACTLVKLNTGKLLATLSDVSAQVLQERQLERSLALLRTVADVAPGIVYAKDRAGRIVLANAAALALTGQPWSQVEGKREDEFLADQRQAEIAMADDRRVMATGKTEEREELVEHPNKGQRVYLSTKVPFGGGDDTLGGLVSLSIDITERKLLAEELLHVSRRTAMGDMAATIAHEINQPLAAIALYLDAAARVLVHEGYDGAVGTSIARAKDQCMRAGDIIRQVRTFGSGGDRAREPEDLRVLVDDACSLALLGSRAAAVTASIEHHEVDILVLADLVQISQVVVNLVRNAIDGMGDVKGAAIKITTGYGPDGTAMVSVSDNGPGVSADLAGRLFEPFVSTKGTKGMGVGLSICRTIVENHGGRIWSDPDVESGATFRFTLPLSGRALQI